MVVTHINESPSVDRAAVPSIAPDSVPDAPDLRDIPAVVAVVVASDPGPDFAQTLSSLAQQDYENLSVLVVDAGSDDPIAERVAEVLPKAYLHRLAGDPGFSVAANQSLELVSGSPFLLFCHDDVYLEPDCVSTLMSELYRNNGGIACPKLVSWDDSRRLAQLGMGSDRFGVMFDQVERGEFDQDQYDAVREVFVAPGGVQLVRADLFAALGGFDPGIKVLGEDLDLCWRAHVAGARVIVVPGAKARHREAMEERVNQRERRRLLARHRLRTVLVTAERRTMLNYVPLAFILILLETLYALAAGRRGQARDIMASIPWNLSRLDDIRRRRRLVRRTRSVSDAKVAELQMRGSARIANFSRGQVSAGQDRFSDLVGSVRSSFAGEDAGNVRDAVVISIFLAVLLLFGSRHLLTRGVVPVGQIPAVPDGLSMFQEWLGGWRSTGTGGPGNAPTALFVLAVGRLLFFWGSGLFQTLVAVGPALFAPLAMYRSLRPLSSARAAMVAALLYACNPLVVAMFSAGRWDALVVWAAAPYMLSSLFKLSGHSPFGAAGGPAGPGVADRTEPVRLIRFGFLVAIVATFVPAIVPVAAVTALVFTIVVLATGDGRPRELALASVVSIVAAVALHGPWSYDLLRSLTWRWVIGPDSPETSFSTLLDLVQFAPNTYPPRVLAFAMLGLAVLALLYVRQNLLYIGLTGWLVAITFWGLAWSDRRGWLPIDVPAPEVLLAMAGAGLCYVVAVGVRTLEIELTTGGLSGGGLRLRKLGATVGSIGVALMFLVGMLGAFSGSWRAPSSNFASSVDFLVERANTEFEVPVQSRVLWIGDASVLPLDAIRSDTGIDYVVTDGGMAEVWGRWQAGPVGSTDGIGRQLDLARAGEIVRLGRLLAPYGIDYVVVTEKLAPSPYDGPTIDAGDGIQRALAQQLDLQRVPGVPDLAVFRNRSSRGVTPLVPSTDQAQATTAAETLDVDLTSGVAGFVQEQPGRWLIEAPEGSDVLVSLHSNGLAASGSRTETISGFDELLVLPSGSGGEVVIEFASGLQRRLAILGQFFLVAIGALLAQTRREVTA